MSVRNQYGRNKPRETSAPPSAAELENIRQVVRRRVASQSRDIDEGHLNKDAKSYNNRKSKNTNNIQRNIPRKAAPRKYVAANNSYSEGGETYRVNQPNNVRSSISGSTMSVQSSEGSEDSVFESSLFTGRSESPESVLGSAQERSSRPMSARPESRWQRRTEDDGTDEEREYASSDFESDSDSGRETGVVGFDKRAKHNEDKGPSKCHRPKTGLGRQVAKPGNPGTTTHPAIRPKSRVGNRASLSDTRRESTSDAGDDDVKDEVGSRDSYSEQMNTRSQKQKSTPSDPRGPQKDRITQGVQQIHFGLDDIDLDVDPVEYFNYFYKFDTFIYGRNPPPTNVMGNDSRKNSLLGRNNKYGHYGHNQNKRVLKADTYDRNYGNKPVNRYGSITETPMPPWQYGRNKNSMNTKYNAFNGEQPAKRRQGLVANGMYRNARVITMGNTHERIHMMPQEEPHVRQPIARRKFNTVQSREEPLT